MFIVTLHTIGHSSIGHKSLIVLKIRKLLSIRLYLMSILKK